MQISKPAPRRTKVTSPFGPRKAPIPGASTFHKGLDFGGKFPVSVAANGKVVDKGYSKTGYGHYVIIRHREVTLKGVRTWQTLYAHGETASNLTVGKRVKTGDRVYWSGHTGMATGDHLHFELRKRVNNTYIPVDPAHFIR
jgi:murein DD-endopeptidase MepM/ murein hydrolase activator NlpD